MNNRAQAIQIAREKLASQPLYLDTETTGIDRSSEIVEICIVDYDCSLVFQSLVKPVGSIPADATRIHGITNDMVRSAPAWYKIWPELESLLEDRTIGIYNAEFDLRLLQQTHARYKIPWHAALKGSAFCIMKLYAQYYGEWDPIRGSYRWQSLAAAGRECSIPVLNTHRALDDTLLAREVLHFIAGAQTDE